VIEFAVPHTLAFTFFPAWVSSLREKFGPIKSRLIALNVHDAVMRLVEGGCDLLIAYHHASQPFQLDADRYEMVTLGQEVLSPYVKPGPDGEPLFRCPAAPASPALPGLCAGRLPGAGDRPDPQAVEHRHPSGPCVRNRHGRGPEGHGAGRPWRGLPAVQRGQERAAGAQAWSAPYPPGMPVWT
jgi:DNA-binding transcriptional LysR family regulator